MEELKFTPMQSASQLNYLMVLHNSLARVPDYSPEHTSLRRRERRSKAPEFRASIHLHYRIFAVAAHVFGVKASQTPAGIPTDRVVIAFRRSDL
jgi:hypothetical protein